MNKIFIISLISTIFIIAGCMGSPSHNAKNIKQPENFLKESIKQLQQKDIKDALISLKRAITQDPTAPKPYIMLGEIYIKAGLYKNAVKYFEAASRLMPNDGKLKLELARCYGLSGENKKSIESLKESIELFKAQNDIKDYKKASALLSALMHTATTKK